MDPLAAEIIDQVIRERCTVKVFAEEPLTPSGNVVDIDALLTAGIWAPFHRPAASVHTQDGSLSSMVPWRFYVLEAASCRRLRTWLQQRGDEGKLPRMLAAATAMIQVTWLPHPPSAESEPLPAGALFEPTLVNMEHLAAASAAVQNVLLAATARGVPTYWSSGGALREAEAFKLLGIPHREIALGSVLLFPADYSEIPGIEHVPGKLRDKRGSIEEFSRRVEL